MKRFILLLILILILLPSIGNSADIYKYRVNNIERGETNIKIDLSVFKNNLSLVDCIVLIDSTILMAFTTPAERITYIKSEIVKELENLKKTKGIMNELKQYEGIEVTIP